MCELCNGTHVVHIESPGVALVTNCPECGPMPEEQWRAKMDAFQIRLDAAELQFEKKGA
ncbi:hypothetical protein LC048_21075 [Mesobacillus subterraneus]|uniref:hypothetical protein n=1 Tax=Mesobacillus subterraneus TaxID=285983 RepID=UPI001CFE97C7|nr:hypothetical protein [Mesobacillus subterraneus]WLR57771.1 hypothetical protein LC048_21075 [Mesobacillus subterraneus]